MGRSVNFVQGVSLCTGFAFPLLRLNLYSFKNGQSASLAWSPIRGQGNFHKSSRFGRIQFQ